ncbi:MAG: DUF885 domain-containing protein [Acidobacteria bacterium]|nr:DUF885 domain-containing protein [Acidobacteriota bacterium]
MQSIMRWRQGLTLVAIALLSMMELQPMSNDDSKFLSLTEEFIYQILAFSPVTATAQGLHRRRMDGHMREFDRELDNYSAAAIEKQIKFYSAFQKRLLEWNQSTLSRAQMVDYRLMMDACEATRLDLERLQSYKHNPTVYVEMIGNALFGPLMLEYAPPRARMDHILERLEKIPIAVQQAKENLQTTDPVYTKVALEENQGNADMIKNDIAKTVEAWPESRKRYQAAAPKALAALEDLSRFLREDLPKRGSRSWQLGAELYDLKFKYTLQTDMTPEKFLRICEARIPEIYNQMTALARQILSKPEAERTASHSGNAQREKAALIREALNLVAQDHTTPERLMPQAQLDLDECVRFTREKNILPLTGQKNLQIIPTPVFMRGVYGVAGFQPAPLLEPALGAFYWVTPVPPEWTPEQVSSKLREYNVYKFKLLTMHEAVPGHYTQAEYANRVKPEVRRLLRGLFGNGPYVEGWAQYMEEVMVLEGFLNHDPRLMLTFLKEELRGLANAILDIRMHRMNMTDAAAMDLMEKTTFQEHAEAVGKLQRAKLSSTQLCYYFLGWTEWRELRKRAQAHQGASFNLANYHSALLSEGAIPVREFYSILGVPR